MKFWLLVPTLVWLSFPIFAEPVKVADTEVTFVAPEGFTPLSKEMIAVKWASRCAPTYAVGTQSGSTTIAYDLKPNPIPQEALPDAQKAFTQMFDRIVPGIRWMRNEINL
jgi:hypothetical protein